MADEGIDADSTGSKQVEEQFVVTPLSPWVLGGFDGGVGRVVGTEDAVTRGVTAIVEIDRRRSSGTAEDD